MNSLTLYTFFASSYLQQSWQTFSVSVQIINIFFNVSPMMSALITQFCFYDAKVAIDGDCNCVPVKLYL